MSATPADVAAMIGGIRAAQPAISAAAIEALMHISAGADCREELLRRMKTDRSRVTRIVNQLTGRGSLGARPQRSKLRLVHKRKHPDRPGFQLLLTEEGQALMSSTFALNRR